MQKREKYLSSLSKNSEVVKQVLASVRTSALTEEKMRRILAECAGQLLRQRFEKEEAGKYQWLIDGFEAVGSEIEEGEAYRYIYIHREDLLGFLYLSLRKVKERKKSGSYYTPKWIAKCVAKNGFLHEQGNSMVVLDPACGTGSILLELPEECRIQNIYGYDIDPLAVAIVRVNMALKYQLCDKELLTEHFVVRDFLRMGTSRKTDVILGNPPWGSEYSREEKEYFRKAFRTAGIKTAESGDMFVEQSLKNLPEGGRICFVLPEALLHVKTHRIVRALMLEQCTVVRAEYLGEVFDKVQCPSVILSLEKRETSVTDKGKGELTRLSEEGFLLDITENEFALLQKLSGMEDAVTLKGQAAFALGIVTGNNARYLTEHKEEGSEPILRGTDIERFKVKEAVSYICFAPDRYQQVAPEALYRAPEKLLYRFVGEKPVFAYDDKRTLTLNSCNIVIPKVAGMDMRYIMAVFNSNVIEFWHKCRNHSMKMLRSHIEAFPIPMATRAEQEEIVGWVKVIQENEQEIQKLQEQNGKEPCEMIINELLVTNEKLCRKLNWKIAQLFGLTDEEYEQMIGCINRRRLYE